MSYVSSVRATLSKLQEPGEFLAQLLGAWRILVVTGVLQLISGVMSLQLHVFQNPFNSFWFGGALATLPSFLLGLWWHNSARSEGAKDCRAIITLYWLIAPLMTLIAWPLAAAQDMVQGVA